MLFRTRVALRQFQAQAGQGMAEYLLILAPVSVIIGLAAGMLLLASSK
jgi:hypothetical protein